MRRREFMGGWTQRVIELAETGIRDSDRLYRETIKSVRGNSDGSAAK